MRTNRPLLLLCLLLLPVFSLADGFSINNLLERDYELTAYRKTDGIMLWKAEVRTRKIRDGQRLFFYVTEEGRGRNQKRDVTWRTDSYFLIEGDRLIPYRILSAFKDLSGRTVDSLSKYYDREKQKVICDHNGRRKEYDLPEGVVDKENLGISLSNFPFGKKGEVRFKLLTNEPALYTFVARYVTEEAIARNGKTIPCYKLELYPQGIPKFILDRFMPHLIFWLEVAPPHYVLHYEGPEGGRMSEKVRIETYLK